MSHTARNEKPDREVTEYDPGPKKIIVTILGGVVQSIAGGKDSGVEVEVWDFDTEGFDPDDYQICMNKDGDLFYRI